MRFLFLILSACHFLSNAQVPYKDVFAEARQIVGSLTLEEKIGQMTLVDYEAIKKKLSDIKEYKIGALLAGGSSNPGDNTPYDYKYLYDSVQKISLQTRSKIPLLFGVDAVHGFSNARNTVVFPHNIGLGCANDEALMEKIGRATAIETRATGINWVFAPCLAVPQDERWGRTYEGYSEQTDIVLRLGGALLNGLQGERLDHNESVLACAKHFIGDGNTNNGIDRGNSLLTSDYLEDSLLPIYKYAIDHNVGSVMASFSSVNGEKCHGSSFLLKQVLRNTLGFTGFLVSDWEAIDLLEGDYYSDVVTSINAGIDLVMVPNRYEFFIETLHKAIAKGDIKIERINEAVERIVAKKIELGLLRDPFVDKSQMSKIRCAAHKELARESVRKSVVVLENNGILPLSKNLTNVFVAGRHADNLGYQCGGWTLEWQGVSGNKTIGTTVLGALRKKLPQATVRYTRNGQGAQNADVAVVVIGEEPYAEWLGDEKKLSFKKEDVVALKNAHASGVPVICVLMVGRPLILESILPYCDALICAWLPGTEGEGITDIIFGDYAPTGKLSYSWPKHMDQVPINIGDANYVPLYPLGYGLHSFEEKHELSVYSLSLSATGNVISVKLNHDIGMIGEKSNFVVENDKGELFEIEKIWKKDNCNEIGITLSNRIQIASGAYISIKENALVAKEGYNLQQVVKQSIYNPSSNDIICEIPGMFQAESFYDQKNVDIEDCWDDKGGQLVLLEKGEHLFYALNVDEDGLYNMIFRAKGLSKSVVRILLEDKEVALFNVPLSRSGKWRSFAQKVNLSKGMHLLKVEVLDGTTIANWISFDVFTVKRCD